MDAKFDWLFQAGLDLIYLNQEAVRKGQYELQWQEKEENQERLKPPHQRLCPNHQEQDFSSPSEELEDSSDTPTTPRESELEPPSTWLLFLSTSLLRSSSSPETPPRTTRRPESSQDTFFWPSETTRNSTSSSTTPPLPKEVSSPTLVAPSLEESKAVESHPKQFDSSPIIGLFTLITMEDKYQCHICMETAHKPIVTPCGHLFCWQCIYFWLRSNQQFLTCPLCKSGLELSTVRPILGRNQEPEREEGGIPPRPRPFLKVKRSQHRWRDIPKSIARMGTNVQRGVMLAGYGIFPSAYLSLKQQSQPPQPDPLSSNLEVNLYGKMKVLTALTFIFVLCAVYTA